MEIAGTDAHDLVYVGFVHSLKELARVSREALDVPALALGVDGVEREARFARPDTPVMTVSFPSGIETLMFLRL